MDPYPRFGGAPFRDDVHAHCFRIELRALTLGGPQVEISSSSAVPPSGPHVDPFPHPVTEAMARRMRSRSPPACCPQLGASAEVGFLLRPSTAAVVRGAAAAGAPCSPGAATRWAGMARSEDGRSETQQAADLTTSDQGGSGLPPLRRGGPGRKPYLRGSIPALRSDADRQHAVDEMLDDVYAASSKSAVQSRRRCYVRILALWGQAPRPISTDKVLQLAAGLHAGRYRSAASVLSQFRVDAERSGGCISGEIARAFTDGSRACSRGLGPPRRALALDLFLLHRLPAAPTPWVHGGPMGPRNCLVISAWWLLREVEVANVRAIHVTIRPGIVPCAEMHLPASKADQEAKGTSRTHACACSAGQIRPDCPVHALWDQILLLKKLYPQQHQAGTPDAVLPLFPTLEGTAIDKSNFTQTVVVAARHLGLPETAAGGMERLSGHSMRATGAQGLARLGMDIFSIQLLGRWGSSTVLAYVRDAAVGQTAALARRLSVSQSLHSIAGAAEASGHFKNPSDFTADMVHDWFRQWLPEALTAARESLCAEVAEYLRCRRPRRQHTFAVSAAPSSGRSSSSSSSPSRSSSSSSSRPQAPLVPPIAAASPAPAVRLTLVGNAKLRKAHLVRCGPPAELNPSLWMTVCGWRYGHTGRACPAAEEWAKCDKCFNRSAVTERRRLAADSRRAQIGA